MQPKYGRFISILLVLTFASLACGLIDEPADDDQEPQATLSATIPDDEAYEDDWLYYDLPEDCYEDEIYDEVEQICLPAWDCEDCEASEADLQGFIEEDWDTHQTGNEQYGSDEEQRLVIYTIHGDEIAQPQLQDVPDELLSLQADKATQAKIWAYFASLIPQEKRSMLTAYVIFTDGPEETLAAVEQDQNDPTKWVLAVDIADASNPEDLTFTLIHEYGHLLTLGADQVQPDADILADPENQTLYEEAAAACPRYFPGEGCSRPDAYINSFYEKYWAELKDEWQGITYLEEDDEYYDALDAFYQKYQDRFITDYAATNPEEDLAETWTHFVLKPKPAGDNIAEEKILFLYEYPELVALRAEIVARTYSRLRRD